MIVSRSSRRRAVALTAGLLLLAVIAGPVARADSPGTSDDAFLDRLRGEWHMDGDVLGRPVRYRAHGERVLQGGFLRLQMIDVEVPPKYEAEVLIGFDAKVGDYVVHWLDRFGAAGARVVATGKRDGNELTINFPYAEGAFRDTFSFDASSDAWSLLLEKQAPAGNWSTFARYTSTRQQAVH